MASVFTRLPSGLKLKGGNITFRPSDRALSIQHTYQPGWSCLWGGDSGTFDLSYFQRLIDLTASLGGNAFRVMGDLSALKRGTLVQSAFFGNLAQVFNYAASQGIYVYYTLSPVQQLDNMTAADVVTYGLPVLEFVQGFANVFAVDVLQEISTWVMGGTVQPTITLDQLVANVAIIYAGLKPNAQIPLTFSGAQGSYTDAGWASDQTYRNPLSAYMDFLDCHVYGNYGGYILQSSDLDPLLAAFPDKTVLIGESGVNLSGTTGQDMEAIRRLALRPEIAGVFVWALDDQNTTSDDQWGIADDSGVLRPKAYVFSTLPSTLETAMFQLFNLTFDESTSLPGSTAQSKANTFALDTTSVITGLSAPNSLKTLGDAAPQFFYSTLKDTNNGDVTMEALVNIASTSSVAAVFARGTAGPTPGGGVGTTMYYLNFSPGVSTALTRLVNGTSSTLATVNTSAGTGAYRLRLVLSDANIVCYVQRLSDLQWMKSDGTFQAGPTACIALADPTPIDGTGGGLCGVWSYDSTGGQVHFDNLIATTPATALTANDLSNIQSAGSAALAAVGLTPQTPAATAAEITAEAAAFVAAWKADPWEIVEHAMRQGKMVYDPAAHTATYYKDDGTTVAAVIDLAQTGSVVTGRTRTQ